MVARNPHPIVLRTPFYATQDAHGPLLHRYLDEQFVARFRDDAGRARVSALQATQRWRQEDRFSRHDDLPSLRLPVHRCFYLLSCEVACDTPGQPALATNRISSAGFVIRRGRPGVQEQIWRLRADQPQGWQNLKPAGGSLEPDEYRYLLGKGLVEKRVPAPPYSGEQTYPLHAMTVKHEGRSRTILYGYVPLGGAMNLPMGPDKSRAQGDADTAIATAELKKELYWPFGEAQYSKTRIGSNGLPRTESRSSVETWRIETGLQVDDGRPTVAMLDLLTVLINRYRLGDQQRSGDDIDDEALMNLLGSIGFLDRRPHFPDTLHPASNIDDIPRRDSLLDYLRHNQNQLVDWLSTTEPDRELTPAQHIANRLPNAPSRWLYIHEAQATLLRDLLAKRLKTALQQQVSDLPVPRYRQARDDVYFIRAFVRHVDVRGCETITWGAPSQAFRIVAPFDPEASRPHLIQLPDLNDLKRGAAKGVAFLAPRKLAEQIDVISPDMDLAPRKGPGKMGLDWIYSFSIPVVTICAMILLMIIVKLLDFFLHWMPWVIVRIPIVRGFRKDMP